METTRKPCSTSVVGMINAASCGALSSSDMRQHDAMMKQSCCTRDEGIDPELSAPSDVRLLLIELV